jgi:hypothetical protein
MSMACSSNYSAVAVEPASFADRAVMRSVVRWAVLGAAGVIALIIALSHSMSASAATPCIQINYTTCVNYTVPTYVAPAYVAPTYVAPSYIAPATTSASGYAPNTVVSSYYDPRYGPVSVVTDASGNLIDVNTATGQRIYPYLPDYGYGFAGSYLGSNYLGANYVGSTIINNGITCGGVYGCPGGPFNGLYNGAYNYGYLNTNVFPAGGTLSGGVVYYNDNRFCGDGKVAFVPNRGYFCQNGGPLVTNGVNTINCGNFFLNGCGIWRGYEADAATPAAATQAQQVTTFAAPEAKAPVVAPAAPVIAPAAPVIAPAAPVVAPAAPVSAKIAVGVPGIAPVGGVQIDPSSR